MTFFLCHSLFPFYSSSPLVFFPALPNTNTVLGVASATNLFNALIWKHFGLNGLKMFIFNILSLTSSFVKTDKFYPHRVE